MCRSSHYDALNLPFTAGRNGSGVRVDARRRRGGPSRPQAGGGGPEITAAKLPLAAWGKLTPMLAIRYGGCVA